MWMRWAFCCKDPVWPPSSRDTGCRGSWIKSHKKGRSKRYQTVFLPKTECLGSLAPWTIRKQDAGSLQRCPAGMMRRAIVSTILLYYWQIFLCFIRVSHPDWLLWVSKVGELQLLFDVKLIHAFAQQYRCGCDIAWSQRAILRYRSYGFKFLYPSCGSNPSREMGPINGKDWHIFVLNYTAITG